MRKFFVVFGVILVLLLLLYRVIPAESIQTQERVIPASKDGLFRNLSMPENWKPWWPGTGVSENQQAVLAFQGRTFHLKASTISSFLVGVESPGLNANSSLTLIPVNYDTTRLLWTDTLQRPLNPIGRMLSWFREKEFRKDVGKLLDSMQAHYSSSKGVYGYDIRKELVVDSALISTYMESNNRPTIDLIYKLVDQLKSYIKNHNARETGFPMLNIYSPDSNRFITRVAIPTDKPLPSTGKISYKWMLGGGNILITEVHGGDTAVARALKQVENYVMDNKRQPPAIPFLSLVTDRRSETDSSKWITRIYYPVM